MVRPAQKSPFAPRVMSPVLFAGVAPADGAASGGVVVVVVVAGAGGDDVVGGAPDAGDAAPSTPDEEHPATSTCASSATTSSRCHDLRATTSPSPRPPTGPDRIAMSSRMIAQIGASRGCATCAGVTVHMVRTVTPVGLRPCGARGPAW